MTKRNSILELWRFAFCMTVLGIHFFNMYNEAFGTDLPYFHAGYLGVEFFFLAAGYFVSAYYEKKQRKKSFATRLKAIPSYAVSRIKRLYPLYLASLLSMLVVRTVLVGKSFSYVVTTLKNCYAEFIMLQWTPIGNEVLVSACWFVPAVFFGAIVFLLLFSVFGRWNGWVIAPVISFFIYRYYFNLIGKIDVIPSYHGMLRGFAGIGIGIFIYYVVAWLQKLTADTGCTKIYSLVAMVISSAIFIGIFIYTNFGHRSKWDYLIIALYAVGLILLMSSTVSVPKKADKCFLALGKSTYPIYILQMTVLELFFTLVS